MRIALLPTALTAALMLVACTGARQTNANAVPADQQDAKIKRYLEYLEAETGNLDADAKAELKEAAKPGITVTREDKQVQVIESAKAGLGTDKNDGKPTQVSPAEAR